MNKFVVHLTIFKFEGELLDPAMPLLGRADRRAYFLQNFSNVFVFATEIIV